MVSRIAKGYIAGCLAAALWGIQPILIRTLVTQEVDTFNIAFFKVFASTITFGIITLIARKFEKVHDEKPKINLFFILAILSLFVNIFSYHWGLGYTFAADVMIIETLSPVFVIILGVIFLKHRFLSLIKNKQLSSIFLLLAFGSIGSGLLIFDPAQTAIAHNIRNLGDLIVTLASITFALYLLMSSEVQRTNRIRVYRLLFYFFAGALVLFIPFIDISNIQLWTLHQWVLVGVISIGLSAIPFILWNTATSILEAAPMSILFNFATISTIFLETIFLDLKFTWNIVLATLMVIYTAYQAKKITDKSREG